jgi:hypothetical protein
MEGLSALRRKRQMHKVCRRRARSTWPHARALCYCLGLCARMLTRGCRGTPPKKHHTHKHHTHAGADTGGREGAPRRQATRCVVAGAARDGVCVLRACCVHDHSCCGACINRSSATTPARMMAAACGLACASHTRARVCAHVCAFTTLAHQHRTQNEHAHTQAAGSLQGTRSQRTCTRCCRRTRSPTCACGRCCALVCVCVCVCV